MDASQDIGTLVVFTKAEVESGRALEGGILKGVCDGETESGGKGFLRVGDAVDKGIGKEQRRTDRDGNK